MSNSVIQSLWIGPELSLMEQLSITSFLKNGHIYHLYTYNPIENIPEGTVIKNGEEILPKKDLFLDDCGSYARFADLFRYELLYKKGGFWVDTDIVCMQPFDFETPYLFAAGLIDDQSAVVTNCVIKTPKGVKVMKDCYFAAKEMGSRPPFNLAGPPLLSEHLLKHQLAEFIVPYNLFCEIPHWEVMGFQNTHITLDHFENAYGIHFYHEMWRRQKIDKNNPVPNSLYEKLVKFYL